MTLPRKHLVTFKDRPY